MNEDTKKKVISITSTLIASQLASKLADKIFVEPEVRGVRDDVKEALIKASFSLASTIIASIIIRQIIGKRWGS
ncbi:hypothetical protein BH24ACT16_BH24ACT16_17260 [soil metagenome]|jgi:hypothetical protein